MSGSELTRIANLLKKKGVKVKRQRGCLGIKISSKGKGKSAYIQVFD